MRDLEPFTSRLIAALELPDDGWHLDVGCGEGALATTIARMRPQMQVVGVDSSESAIARARELAAGVRNVSFHHGDAASPPEAKYSRISAAGVLNLLPDKVLALLAWRRASARDAALVIADSFIERGAGTLAMGASSVDGLALAARRSGWRIAHREDLTSLVRELQARRVWPGTESLSDGHRYALVTLRTA